MIVQTSKEEEVYYGMVDILKRLDFHADSVSDGEDVAVHDDGRRVVLTRIFDPKTMRNLHDPIEAKVYTASGDHADTAWNPKGLYVVLNSRT